ncbi:MAG: hypothetical protein BAJALOKI2v1_170032 [Promethearchaeota archaeon]|nr:MAG: hypothetical protein BAJALOKI2v1_170032 [Candidatus Lokiarchaeota archaeon]
MTFKEKFNANETFGFNINKFYSVERRFEAIYLVDYISGSLLVSNNYSGRNKFKHNEDLITGFLSAINAFIKELHNENRSEDNDIQEINFKDTRILYERKGRLMVIGISKKTNLQIEREILQKIVRDFYNRFEHQIEDFNGIVDPDILNYKQKLKKFTNLDSINNFDIKI